MSSYTTSKTTTKRDKCIQRKQSEISALKTENAKLRARVAELEAIQVGTVEKPQIKPLRRHIGEADNGTTKLVVTVGAIANTPIIEHPDGRIWSISWNEIIELAIKAFDKEGAHREKSTSDF